LKGHESRHGLNDGVVGRERAQRTGLSKSRGGSVDQAWIARAQGFIREAQTLHGAGSVVLREDVRAINHREKDLTVAYLLQVEDNRFFAAIDGIEIRPVGVTKGRKGPRVVTVGRLNFDDPRTLISQHHGGVRTIEHVGEINDEEVGKRPRSFGAIRNIHVYLPLEIDLQPRGQSHSSKFSSSFAGTNSPFRHAKVRNSRPRARISIVPSVNLRPPFG